MRKQDQASEDVLSIRGLINPSNWSIRNKILSAMVLSIFLAITALTISNYVSLSKNTIETAGIHMVDFGSEALQRASDIIDANVHALLSLSLSPSIVEAAEAANQKYANQTQAEIDAEIARLDQAWKDNDASVESLASGIAGNAVSAHLQTFLKSFPDNVEVFVTDQQGLNIAMTDRTSDYLQADEGWWQGAYANQQGAVFIGDVEYDDSAGAWAMNIGVPVYSPITKQVVGILRGTVDVSAIFSSLSTISFGETGYASLIDQNGT
ncbi:MAG: cache domain-containing protein, partial [Acidimicrobiia bacterium]